MQDIKQNSFLKTPSGASHAGYGVSSRALLGSKPTRSHTWLTWALLRSIEKSFKTWRNTRLSGENRKEISVLSFSSDCGFFWLIPASVFLCMDEKNKFGWKPCVNIVDPCRREFALVWMRASDQLAPVGRPCTLYTCKQSGYETSRCDIAALAQFTFR